MNRRTIAGRWYSAVLLAVMMAIVGAGSLYMPVKTAQSSESSPASVAVPQRPIRGFIALPSVDTVRVQNVYSTSVQVEIAFVEPDGQVAQVVSDTLPAASGRIYAKPTDFTGFANIGTDLQVQAVNFDLDETGNGAYLGVNLAAQTVSAENQQFTFDIPIAFLVKDSEGWNARFSLLNPSDFTAVLTITYYDQMGAAMFGGTKFLESGQSLAVDLAEISEVPLGFVGSAVIASNHVIQVANSVHLYKDAVGNDTVGNDTVGLRSAYRAQFAETPVAVPALFKQVDLQTSQLCVQSITSGVRQINVEYTDGVTAGQAIPAYSTHCFDQGSEAHADGWTGGAVITSDAGESVVLSAIVVVDADDQGETVGSWAYALDGKDHVDDQKALAFPLLYNDYQGWTSAIHLTNYGEQATTVTPHYDAQSGFAPCVDPFQLAAGETRTLTQADLPAQFDLGSAYFTSTLPVAAVVSATNNRSSGETDRHFGYGAAYLESPGTPANECAEGGYAGQRPLDEQYWSYQRGYYMGIGAPAMWTRGLTGIQASNPVTVAVIDTGVDLNHPDLVDNLAPGYDFVDEGTPPEDTSSDSHGTKVAGIIAARMNNDLIEGKARGVAGIGGGDVRSNTPGLRIMPLRVSAGSETAVDCDLSAQAIDYAVDHGATIINISYGSDTRCEEELTAIQRAYDAGLVIVAGAGNDSSATPFFPAAYGEGENNDLVLAVAGLESSGAKALPSNYGEWIDFGAPYHQIRSLTKDGGYASDDGTSFSAPLVSGLLGLLMSNSGWSREQAIGALRTTADNVDAANHEQYHGLLGAGRINGDRASEDLLPRLFLPIVFSEIQ